MYDHLRYLASKCLILYMLMMVHVLAIIKARHALDTQPQWARVEISFGRSVFFKILLIPFRNEDWTRQILALGDQ